MYQSLRKKIGKLVNSCISQSPYHIHFTLTRLHNHYRQCYLIRHIYFYIFSFRLFSVEIQYCVTVLKGVYQGKRSFLSQVQDIHKVAFCTGPIRQSERQHIPRIHFTGVSMPILALQLTTGLEFCTTSSQGSCYDRVRASEGHFIVVKQRYMTFPLPKISACLRVVKSSVHITYGFCKAWFPS